MIQYISNTDHYTEVIARMCKARRLLWLATADLKDLYVIQGKDNTVPFLQVLRDLLKKGVEVRKIITIPSNMSRHQPTFRSFAAKQQACDTWRLRWTI